MENKYIMFNYYSSLTDDRGNILGEIDERIICNKCGSNNLDFCINKKQKEKMNKYIALVEEKGDSVYYPARDTDQNDSVGFRICSDNKRAIVNSEVDHYLI